MVDEAESQLEAGAIAELYLQRKRNRWLQKWDELQIEQQVLWAKRAQEKGMITSDRMSKEMFQRICPPRALALMRELHHPFYPEADVAKDSEAIGECALEYFQDILTSRRPPFQTLQQLQEEQDLWRHTQTSLSQGARLSLDRPITLEELWEVVKSMAKGKSPGSDGLPVEFYEAVWLHVGPILLSLYNRVLEGGSLTADMKMGIIMLIYKKGDKCNIRNWRPISRLNVSYKILSKLLARKLTSHLPDLAHPDQGAFVEGRAISENIMTAMGALEIIHQENRQVLVAMLDLEKAYDRVNSSFVLATLEHMNFGPMYRRWVKELYVDATATIMVNDFLSPILLLTRSLRQGCPLASLLFAIQMEVLLNALRAAPRIQGLARGPGHTLLTGAIADDLLLVMEATADSTGEAKRLLDAYADLSEARVNWNKSLYFLPSDYDLEGGDWGMKRITPNLSERYLGVQVALSDARPKQDLILKAKAQASLLSCRMAVGVALMGRALLITTAVFAQLWYVAAICLISKPQ
ncbi:hypothetical protein CBR_g38055 [Chara braunii]|uniref:Reverse transcriptase domain-containing protein n=1 Tax=Chara braunii TaxID=69332 RepID=A0A388K084_CHABU|nr:hypothetical protein CBR_g38055 [Chara braunii]|eukprot:GBG63435.1 hypothetical protein CBR_g38055 [Chara braunii]